MPRLRTNTDRRQRNEQRQVGGRPMKAIVTVMLKDGVLDPQGRAIGHALRDLGFAGVGEVRAGKVIEVEIAGADSEAARAAAEEMGRRLLANTVIERFDVSIREA